MSSSTDLQVDKKIIGYMLSDKQYLAACAERLQANFFTEEDPHLPKLFTLIVQYFKKYRQIITSEVLQHNLKTKNAPTEKLLAYTALFSELTSDIYKPEEFDYYLNEIIKRQSRHLIKELLTDKGKEDGLITLLEKNKPLDALEKMKKTIIAVETLNKTGEIREGSIKNSADDIWNSYLKAKENPEEVKGIMTGLLPFDMEVNGLKGGQTLGIFGQTGAGKSISLVNIAKNTYLAGLNSIYFSLELDIELINRRFLSCLAEVKSNGIRDGTLIYEEQERFKETLEKIKAAKNHFYPVDVPRGCTVSTIEGAYRKVLNEFEPDIVIVDYLEIMSSDYKVADHQALGLIAKELHDLARTIRKPIVFASQATSLRNKDNRTEIGTHRVARSEGIPQNTDFMLQIEPDPNPSLSDTATFWMVKVRDGATGKSFKMKKDFSRILFSNMAQEDKSQNDLVDEEISNL